MNGVTILKRSPIILIRNLIIIEIAAFFLYYLAAALGPVKYQLYTQLSLQNLLSYQVAKLLLLSGAQLIITIYAFLRWYYESYTIQSGVISHHWGVFFKHEKTMPLDKAMTVTISSGPLGKILHYGSIHIENPAYKSSLILSSISRPKDYLKTIERAIDPARPKLNDPPDVARLMSQDENEKLEFKSSLRFDHKQGQVNRELERAAMKTVAAFLNSKGGYLVVGLDNERKPLGLEKDYQTLHRHDSDGFENHFTQVFNNMIGPESRHLVKLWFHRMDGSEICVIQAASSARPVYLKMDDSEHFYVRTGNVTTPLKFSEVESYTRSRWPRRN